MRALGRYVYIYYMYMYVYVRTAASVIGQAAARRAEILFERTRRQIFIVRFKANSTHDSPKHSISMDFKDKTVEEVGEWLKSENFSENTVRIFAGKYLCAYHIIILLAKHTITLAPKPKDG